MAVSVDGAGCFRFDGYTAKKQTKPHHTTGLYLPTGGVGELCLQLQAKLLTFEAMLAKTAVRRLLCISQVRCG